MQGSSDNSGSDGLPRISWRRMDIFQNSHFSTTYLDRHLNKELLYVQEQSVHPTQPLIVHSFYQLGGGISPSLLTSNIEEMRRQ